jgi:PucR C-terminal helix-turn-helix domain
MSELVQRLAEDLAGRLGRSVEVDDRGLRPLGITAQLGAIDQVRIEAVLQRHSGPEMVAHAESFGIRRATRPVRMPSNEKLGTLPRLCVPVRSAGQLYGYLWLIDAEPPLTDADVAAAVETAAEIGAALCANDRSVEAQLADDSRIVAQLFSADPAERAAARDAVTRQDRLAPDARLAVLVARLDATAETMHSVAADLRRGLPSGRLLVGFKPGAIVLVAHADLLGRSVQRLISNTAAHHKAHSAGAGIGPTSGLDDELAVAYERAEFTARIATVDPAHAGLARWSELGALTAFCHLPWTNDTLALLHPGASRLLAPELTTIRDTVLTYLELGGDTRTVTAALAIHRTTLYYRLDRAGELLGASWQSGPERLGLHLALRLHDLMARERELPRT